MWRRPRVWGAIALTFAVFGLINASQTYVYVKLTTRENFSWALAFAGDLPFWLANLIAFPIVIWAVHAVALAGPRWKRGLAFHSLVSVGYAAVKLLVSVAIAHPLVNALGDAIPLGQGLRQVFTGSMAGAMTMYWAQAGVVLAVDYYVASRERERETARAELRTAHLETNLERARLDWLRSQLNPHFLFNTLNSISTLARQKRTDTVVKTLAELGDLLRATLSHSASEVPLEQEIALLDRYLNIERLRFGERLSATVVVAPEALRAAVPSLLLQPLVENALKHGAGEIRGPVDVVVRARLHDEKLHLEVTDSGRGFPQGWREGVGLSNTRARLRQLHGSDATLMVLPLERGASVLVTLPYQPIAEESARTTSETIDPSDSAATVDLQQGLSQ